MEEKTNRHAVPLRCIAFFAVFCVMFVYISYLVRPHNEEWEGFNGLYSEEKDRCDVVCVGGSVSIVCWAPYTAWKETGMASYVYGVSWARSTTVKPMIKEVYKTQSPQLLIIDLRPFQYTTVDSLEERVIRRPTDWMPYSINRFQLIHKMTGSMPPMSSTDLLTYYIDILKYHGNWQELSKDSFSGAIFGSRKSETKGYMLIPKVVPVVLNENADITKAVPVEQLAEDDLRELIDYLKAREQQTLFVVTTYVEREEERKQYNYLKEIIEENGFDYLNANDYNAVMNMDETTDYYNDNHTNIYGAEKYTAFLANYIDEKYDLPDRREDPAYSDWYAGYERWVELSDATKSEITALIEQRETEENPSE